MSDREEGSDFTAEELDLISEPALTEDPSGDEEAGPEAPAKDEAPQDTPAADGKQAKDAGKTDEPADDWRKAIAGDDEDLLAALKRFADREAYERSLRESQRTITKQAQKLKQAIFKPGENATEDEIKAFREALGVPDAPDGYKVDFSSETPVDKELVTGFLKAAHGANYSQEQVEVALKSLDAAAKAAEEQRAAAAEALEAEREKEAHVKYGKEFDTNMELAKRVMAKYGGRNVAEFLDLRLEDGTRLGTHPLFVDFFFNVGRDLADETDLLTGEDLGVGDIDAEIEKLTKLAVSDDPNDNQRYESPEVQDRLRKLQAIKLRSKT